jgi:uroporphyrinogen decarboxylase
MNPYERMTARLAGEAVDRPPNFDIFMQFGARKTGKKQREYYLDHRVLVEANMAVIENFDVDIVQAISDPVREAADFGAEIEFPEDDMPLSMIPLIKAPEDLKKLVKPSPYTGRRMRDRLEAIRLFREQVGGEYPIMGWVEGALAEASDLRNINNLMLDVVMRPEWVEELCEICVEVAIDFARAQVEAGADIIGLGDAVGSLINPDMYRRFALPYEQRIFDAVHEMGALARLHICGNTNKIVDDMVASGADIVDLDYMVDMEAAAAKHGDSVSFCGNFNPVTVMLQGTPDEVYDATIHCMKIGGSRAFSAGGCEIPMWTPDENLRAQDRALADWGNS